VRRLLIATMALAAPGIALLASLRRPRPMIVPGACAQGWGYPSDCSYQTYAQCMAGASGRYATCNVNPRVAFARQRRGRPPYLDD